MRRRLIPWRRSRDRPVGCTRPQGPATSRSATATQRLCGCISTRLPSGHPYLLMLPQDKTEEVLAARIATLGGVIHRGRHGQPGFEQDGTGARRYGERPRWRACDLGALCRRRGRQLHSLVRQASGIGFRGRHLRNSFVLADVPARVASRARRGVAILLAGRSSSWSLRCRMDPTEVVANDGRCSGAAVEGRRSSLARRARTGGQQGNGCWT
jgi:hypothetical protein